MALFSYEARNAMGDLVAGIINADSVQEASDRLCRQELYVVKLGAADRNTESKLHVNKAGSKARVKSQDVMWFISQLSIMVETGIPLSDGLDCLSRQTSSPAMKPVLTGLSKAVSEGRSLSDAMNEYPRVFAPTTVALVRASEMSGTLSSVLKRIAEYLLKDHLITKRMKGALIYPSFMFGMCVVITVFLLVFILPKFASIFASRGAALPAPTRFLMGTSDLLIYNWIWIVMGLVSAGIGIHLWHRTMAGRIQIDRFKLTLPVISTVFNKLYQSRTFRTLGTLLQSGVPLTDALEITADVSGNVFYADLWQRVNQSVKNGENIAGPLQNSALIPESVGYMIESGDRSGQLALVFGRLAAFVEEEYDQAIKTLMQMVEPVIVMFMCTLIGFIAISVLLPLFQTSKVMTH